jgi:hypothetical protein
MDSLLLELAEMERELIAKVSAAGWEAESERFVDGSLTPAVLIREGGRKPERMPPISDLAAAPTIRYATLSEAAHASRSALGADQSLNMLLHDAFMTVTSCMTFINWCGVPLKESPNAAYMRLLDRASAIWPPPGEGNGGIPAQSR